MSPIKLGCPPGQRRTYEQIARAAIANLQGRHAAGLPTELGKLSTIHFGRMIILRPEQYLSFSRNANLAYAPPHSADEPAMPAPIDDFMEVSADRGATAPTPTTGAEYRSWILTMVEFDGDLKVYMREIARSLNSDFDAIFQTCEGYPGAGNFEAWWQWIRRFQISTDLFYATYPGLSVVRIKQLEAFKRNFDTFVAQVRSPTGPLVASMDEMFDQFLADNQQYAAGFPSPGGLFPSISGKKDA